MYFDLSAMQIILETLVLGLAIGGIGAGGIALYFGSKRTGSSGASCSLSALCFWCLRWLCTARLSL